MSLWLSAAHKVAGTWRGQATAQATRQVKAAIADATAAPARKARPRRKG